MLKKFEKYNFRPKLAFKASAKGLYDFPENMRETHENARRMILDAMAEPFVGVTAEGEVETGLYSLRKSGLDLTPIVEAAQRFMRELKPFQRAVAQFDVDDLKYWRRWSNTHPFVVRHGVCLDDLSSTQREAALALVQTSMSTSGFATVRNAMKLNHTLGEITGLFDDYDEWYYWVSMFGTPALGQPWGWQFDGHHANLNCAMVGDQLVMTPQFLGAEPVYAPAGCHAGAVTLQAEEESGLKLMRALEPNQRQAAQIGEKISREVFTTPGARDNMHMRYEGIGHNGLNHAQQAMLWDVVKVYIERLPAGHAELKLDEVRRHLERTYFAWIGPYDDIEPFYYRIHSPVVLIEFDHVRGVGLDSAEPHRNHIHTMVRTPNGNDYGRDLLRQHYEQHDHARPHGGHH